MSSAPRPHTSPFTSSPPKGSRVQCSGVTGTTSVWPMRQSVGAAGSVPSMRATRLVRPGAPSGSYTSTSRPLPSRYPRSTSLVRPSWPEPTLPSFTHRLRISCCNSSTVCPVSASFMAAVGSELGHARARAVLILLRGAAADAARAVDDAVADDRHRALAGDHVAALGGGDALDDRGAGALLQLTARPREGSRRDRLPLRAVGARPQRAIHAVERDQASAGVAHRDADLDVQLFGAGERALYDLVGFRESQHGWRPPVDRCIVGAASCITAEEVSMAQTTMPPWIQVLHRRDPKFVDAYMAQREHILRDGAIPAKYKHLMTMIVDALQTHPDGVATIANRARAAGASEAEIQEAVEITYLFGGTPALATARNPSRPES